MTYSMHGMQGRGGALLLDHWVYVISPHIYIFIQFWFSTPKSEKNRGILLIKSASEKNAGYKHVGCAILF